MKTFVISLTRCTDRREYIAKHLKEHDLSFSFWDATEGAKLTPEEVERYIDQKAVMRWSSKGLPLKPGEIGCAISHIRLWEHLIETNTAQALILEDDVIIQHDHINVLISELAELPQSREVILLNSNQNSTWLFQRHQLSTGERLQYANGKANLTSAYIINIKTVKALTNHIKSNRLKFPIDCWCATSRDSFAPVIKTRVVIPNPIIQAGDILPSTINPHGGTAKRRPLKNIINNIRNIIRSTIPPRETS